MDNSWALLCPGVFCLEDCTNKVDASTRSLCFQELYTRRSSTTIRSLVPQIVCVTILSVSVLTVVLHRVSLIPIGGVV